VKRIEVDKASTGSDDCSRCEKLLSDAKIPFDRIEQEKSGAVVLYVEDRFEQATLEVLRQAVLSAARLR
jgi:hypothetical protein